jgi:hypothetical protein
MVWHWREPNIMVKERSDAGANPIPLAGGGHPDILVQPGG